MSLTPWSLAYWRWLAILQGWAKMMRDGDTSSDNTALISARDAQSNPVPEQNQQLTKELRMTTVTHCHVTRIIKIKIIYLYLKILCLGFIPPTRRCSHAKSDYVSTTRPKPNDKMPVPCAHKLGKNFPFKRLSYVKIGWKFQFSPRRRVKIEKSQAGMKQRGT